MVTIKAYTDTEQSKKLAEILPLESADMCFNTRNNMPPLMTSYSRFNEFFNMEPTPAFLIPCWSLAALLDVLPKKYYPIKDHETDLILGKPKDKWCVLYWDATGMQNGEQTLEDNPVDACYEMILKLHELKML